MKKIVCAAMGAIVVSSALAQAPAYPQPRPFADLVALEYFINRDPGVGNGTPVPISAAINIPSLNINVDLSGVGSGFQRIYLRSRNANGNWGQTYNAFFDNFLVPVYPVAAATVDMVSAEYFIDNDPGEGNGIPITFAPGPTIANHTVSINVTGLSTGVHRVFIRTKDIQGKWSLTNFGLFDNSVAAPYPAAPSPAATLSEMEYYFDNDPGFGNATPITFTPGSDISNLSLEVPINNLPEGNHTLHIRSRNNPWSHSAYADFTVGTPLPVTWLYVQGKMTERTATLEWATSAEVNAATYLVEHSTNLNQYTQVGELQAAGNSTATHKYRFEHAGVKPGINYYRIRQVDQDGKYTYSKMITLLNRTGLRETIVAPNPVSTTLHIIEPGKSSLKQVEIFDLSGKRVLVRGMSASQQQVHIDVSGLSRGAYVVILHYPSERKQFKIIKQ